MMLRSPEIARQAKAAAAIYRSLALELLRAGAVLEKATGVSDEALPAVSTDRLAQAMLAGMHLHYLAKRVGTREGAPLAQALRGYQWLLTKRHFSRNRSVYRTNSV